MQPFVGKNKAKQRGRNEQEEEKKREREKKKEGKQQRRRNEKQSREMEKDCKLYYQREGRHGIVHYIMSALCLAFSPLLYQPPR